MSILRPFFLVAAFSVGSLLSSAQEAVDVERLDPNMTLTRADSEGIAWFDPRVAPFQLSGFPWIDQDQVFRRLPLNPDWEIRAPVDSLANCTAGGQIRFRTDSDKLLLRVELRQPSGMYHMPATGQSGFDLYIGEPGKEQYLATTRFAAKAGEYEVALFGGDKRMRSFTLNFPLYNGVNSVELGVVAGATVSAPKKLPRSGRVVVYGTSITQGGCAARPGMAYPNILSRRLGMEFVNLGFSGNGRGEPALANLICQIEAKSLVILDYQANAGESIRETLDPFVDVIRGVHPELPILIVSKILYASELNDDKRMRAARDLARFQLNLVERRREDGDRHIYFLDGADLLGTNAHECTVDGVHPTDLGFLMMAERIAPAITDILD